MTGFTTLLALAFGLSVDAFAAALGKGAGERATPLIGALRSSHQAELLALQRD